MGCCLLGARSRLSSRRWAMATQPTSAAAAVTASVRRLTHAHGSHTDGRTREGRGICASTEIQEYEMAWRRHCDIAIREATKGEQQIERHRGIDVRRPWPWLALSAGWSAAHRDHPVAPPLLETMHCAHPSLPKTHY
jgi:hypothetical protein